MARGSCLQTLEPLKIVRSRKGQTVPDVILTEDAYVGTGKAANAGDSVPQDIADKNGWEYARKGTKAAKEAEAEE